MSAGEYVVIQVWTAYALTDGKEGRWLDYSRCTARQAQSHLAADRAGKFRAVHWIYTDQVLDARQLDAMVRDTIGKYADKPPAPTVELSVEEARALGEVLFNALDESDPSNWSDYDGMVATLRKIGSPFILGMWDERH